MAAVLLGILFVSPLLYDEPIALSGVNDSEGQKVRADSFLGSLKDFFRGDVEMREWDESYTKKVSVFTVLSSATIVVGMVVSGYYRYAKGDERRIVVYAVVLTVLTMISFFYMVLFSGVIQVF